MNQELPETLPEDGEYGGAILIKQDGEEVHYYDAQHHVVAIYDTQHPVKTGVVWKLLGEQPFSEYAENEDLSCTPLSEKQVADLKQGYVVPLHFIVGLSYPQIQASNHEWDDLMQLVGVDWEETCKQFPKICDGSISLEVTDWGDYGWPYIHISQPEVKA